MIRTLLVDMFVKIRERGYLHGTFYTIALAQRVCSCYWFFYLMNHRFVEFQQIIGYESEVFDVLSLVLLTHNIVVKLSDLVVLLLDPMEILNSNVFNFVVQRLQKAPQFSIFCNKLVHHCFLLDFNIAPIFDKINSH